MISSVNPLHFTGWTPGECACRCGEGPGTEGQLGWHLPACPAHSVPQQWPSQWQGPRSFLLGSGGAFALACYRWSRMDAGHQGSRIELTAPSSEEACIHSCFSVLMLSFAVQRVAALDTGQAVSIWMKRSWIWVWSKWNNWPVHLEQLYFYGNDSSQNVCLSTWFSQPHLWWQNTIVWLA